MPAARNEEKRTHILRAAFDLYSNPDAGRVSLADIAAASDINKSLLQHYFPQKKDLMEALLKELLEVSFRGMPVSAEEDFFQQISDFNMLFFKTAAKNKRFNRFVTLSVSEPDSLEIWIDTICHWLRDLCDEDTFTYLQLRTALSFSMTGSMYLYLHRDELNIDYRYFCDNHMRSILKMLGFPSAVRDRISERTKAKLNALDTEAFLNYCREHISFFCI